MPSLCHCIRFIWDPPRTLGDVKLFITLLSEEVCLFTMFAYVIYEGVIPTA